MGLFSSIKKIGKKVWKGVKSVGSSLSDAIPKVISGIPGAIVGGAIDLGSSWLGNKLIGQPNADEAFAQSQAASAKAFEQSHWAYKQRYQNTMADMAKAGLNPILAAGSAGFNVGGQPEMSQAKSFVANYPQQSAASAYQMMAAGNYNQEKSETEQVERVKKAEETMKVAQDRWKSFEETVLTRTQNRKVAQEIRLTKQMIWNKIAEFEKTIAESYQALSHTEVNQAKVDQIKAQEKNLRALTQKLEYQMAQLKMEAKIYEGQAGQILKYIKEVISALNPLIPLVNTIK